MSALAIVLAMALVRRRILLAGFGLLGSAASAFWISAVPPQLRTGVLEITAIDVGQGDSILLVSPGGRTSLVHAGGLPQWVRSDLDIREDVVSPYLWSRSIRRLDAVAITHPHADHMGWAPAILSNFRPRELWLADSPDPEMKSLLQRASELGVRVVYHQAGDESLVMKVAVRQDIRSAGRRCGETISAEDCRRGAGSRPAEDGASRERDVHHSAAAGASSCPLRCDFRRSAEYLRTPAKGGSCPAERRPRPTLSHRSRWSGYVLARRQYGQD